ncbi:MAG: nitroreductase family protein [Phycisphaerae bacterium]
MATSSITREPEFPVDRLFLDRWSPRAFAPDPIPHATLMTLFEAARWAPSCFNDQPWYFVYAAEPSGLAKIRSILVEKNRIWADRAPVLALVCSHKQFKHNNQPNRWAPFDAGAAWMSLALQASMLGLCAHAMAGFDLDAAYTTLDLPREKFDIHAAVAIGRRGDSKLLPEELAAREGPTSRKPLAEIIRVIN